MDILYSSSDGDLDFSVFDYDKQSYYEQIFVWIYAFFPLT